MARTPLWLEIEDVLRGEIGGGLYRAGDKLPTEQALAARFGVNRHTVRRALAALSAAGMTHARRGSGVYVTAEPTEYRIGRRTRFQQNLASIGQTAERETIRLETRFATEREADALALAPDQRVHVFEGIGLTGEVPLLVFRSAFPAERLPKLPASLRRDGSITRALAAEGVGDYVRASTRISAEAASATQAGHLRCQEGAPLIRTVSVNHDPDGQPIEFGDTWFVGERVQIVIEPGSG